MTQLNWPIMIESLSTLLSLAFLAVGTLFIFLAGLGMLRLPDVYNRLHASTKAGALGTSMFMIALMLEHPSTDMIVRGILAILFILITTPVSGHALGRAAYHAGVKLHDKTIVNQMPSPHGELKTKSTRRRQK